MLLTSYTEFTIKAAKEEFVEEVDLILLPEVVGIDALRRLSYPNDLFPPLDYPDNPDGFDNFDTVPLTARPLLKAEMTLADTVLARWPGYQKDHPIRERWRGTDKIARMTTYFVRRFLEYFLNRPASGYITWEPRDLSGKKYNIEIEDFTIGGQDVASFLQVAHYNEVVAGEIIFTFRIVGEVT